MILYRYKVKISKEITVKFQSRPTMDEFKAWMQDLHETRVYHHLSVEEFKEDGVEEDKAAEAIKMSIESIVKETEPVDPHTLGADNHPQPAPGGQQWRCVDCGHHAKDTHQIPGLCEHRVVLVDENTLQPVS
jgi:hypothetical protein